MFRALWPLVPLLVHRDHNNMKKIILLIFLSQNAFAIEPQDNYYSNDLDNAVHQAKENPHHYDYSSNYRYKRTTAQSIELNRLDLNELDETRLEITGNTTDATHVASMSNLSEDKLSNLKQEDLKLDKNHALKIQAIVPTLNSSFSSNVGDFKSTGIQQNGVLISTPRP